MYALKTGERDVARFLASSIRLRLDQFWREIGGVADGAKVDHVIVEALRRRFKADLDNAFRQYAEMQADRDYDPALQREAEENAVEGLRGDNADPLLREYLPAALAMLHSVGYPAEATDQQTRVLARHMIECAGLIAESRLRWHSGKEGYRPRLRTHSLR
nr:hypothetical protein [Acetobacter sp. DsW_063]